MSILRPHRLLAPLVPVYAAAAAAADLAYRRGWVGQRHLRAPVISVGNLSVGGAGKTPFVICLARLLARTGYSVDVLSRGYGRRSAGSERVDAASGDAERYGDEPLLIAGQTGLPVYVGQDRYAAGVLAETVAALPSVHLLDDGFQHRQLARAVDLVLLHPSDAREWLLPAGRLREPMAALRRAHVVVLRAEDTTTEAVLRRGGLALPVWRVARELVLPRVLLGPDSGQGMREVNTGVAAEQGPDSGVHPSSTPVRAVAFCGIAHPQEFFAALAQAGCPLVGTYAFADHHPYTAADIETLAAHVLAAQATHLLTTEKDWVRLPEQARSRLSTVTALHAIPLRTRLLDEHRALAQLAALAGLPAVSG